MTDLDFGTITSLIISCLCLTIAIWVIKDALLKKILCTKETKAEIIGYHEMLVKSPIRTGISTEVSYFCEYKYRIGETNFEGKSDLKEWSRIFKIGSEVTLRYNPKDHKQQYIVESSLIKAKIDMGIFFILCSLVFLNRLLW